MKSGNQVNFYLTPKDLVECEQRLREVGPIKFFGYVSSRGLPEVLPSTAIMEMGKSWLAICLTRPQDLPSVRFDFVEAQNYYCVDILRSPVVELNRCYFDGQMLRRGRLYFMPEFYDEAAFRILKDSSFIKWANAILTAAKEGLSKDSCLGSYIGQEAEQLSRSGRIKFVA